MNSTKERIDKRSVEPVFFPRAKLLLLISLLGLLLSTYLFYHHVEVTGGFQQGASFCSWNSSIDCDSVARSEFSVFFGVPVAGWSILYYLALVGFFSLVRPNLKFPKEKFNSLALLFSIPGLIASLFFATISFFVINKICLLCCGLYLISIVLFGAAFSLNTTSIPLLTGLSSALSDTRQFLNFNGENRISALLITTSLFLAFIAIVFAPSFLITEWFLPAQRELQAEQRPTQQQHKLRNVAAINIESQVDGPASTRDFSRGPTEAPVTIVIFSDFECPHCQKAAETIHQLQDRLKFRLIYKDFPLDRSCNRYMPRELHRYACKAALAARCAGAQGDELFWKAHDFLFKQTELSDSILEELPNAIGLDRSSYSSCRLSEMMTDKLQMNIEQAHNLRLQGTPAIYINGKPLTVFDPGTFEALLTEEIKAQR